MQYKETLKAINRFNEILKKYENSLPDILDEEREFISFFNGELAKAIVVDSGNNNALETMRHIAAYLRITDKELLEELRK